MRTPGLRLPGRTADPYHGPVSMRREAEQVAALLPPLLVAAERVAATIEMGVHGRRRVGQGETFWQFRRYQPGDSIQRIDWRQSAKRQHVYIRQNEWEAAESVWLWQDLSPSMYYRSGPDRPEKAYRGIVLTLALMSLLIRGGERIALLGSGLPPSNGRAVLQRVAAALSEAPDDAPSLPPVQPLPRHARLVVVGDLLSPIAEIEAMARGFAGVGVHGHLLQIVDSSEETLPFKGRVRFEGLEGEGAALIGRVEAVRDDYIAVVDNHRQAIADLARSIGWSFFVHRTDKAPQSALLALYAALAEGVGD